MASESLKDASTDELFESLIIEAQFVPGDSRVFEEGQEVKWLDMDLAQSGQKFFQKYYASILFAHSLYLGLGFGFKPVTGVVIKTGGFKGIARTTKRVLATIWHVVRWYETDIIGKYAAGFKAIANIRCTHDAIRRKCGRAKAELDFDGEDDENDVQKSDPVSTALQSDLAFLDMSTFDRMDLSYDPPEHMSQFSMAMTQISFLLPVIAHPTAFGIHDTKGFEGFEHLWALIGHLSGLDDRYNIPLQKPGKEFYVKFWKEVFIPSFLVRDSKINAIQESYFSIAGGSLPQMSIPATFYFFLGQSEIEGFKGKELYKLLNWKDKIIIFLFSFVFAIFRYLPILRNLVNSAARRVMKGVLEKYAKEEDVENNQFTTLPKNTQEGSARIEPRRLK
jgi:hypothetical protein